MESKEQLATVQIGKEYIPFLKAMAKLQGRSMRKTIERYIAEESKKAGLV